MPATTAAPTLAIKLHLPERLLDSYQAEADNYGVSLEELISHRLMVCRDHNAQKPLYFNDSDRRELEKILGKNVASTADALALLRRMVSIKLAGANIEISPGLLRDRKSTRLNSSHRL